MSARPAATRRMTFGSVGRVSLRFMRTSFEHDEAPERIQRERGGSANAEARTRHVTCPGLGHAASPLSPPLLAPSFGSLPSPPPRLLLPTPSRSAALALPVVLPCVVAL